MQHVTSQYSGGRFVSPLNVLRIKMYTVFIMWHVSVENNALSALFVTVCCQLMILHFLLLLCICPFAHYTCIAYIPRTVQRDKNCVLLVLASVPYMSLFVYDTVCIGSPGTTSASGSTSACGKVTASVKLKITLRIGIRAADTSPTRTTREESPGGGFPAGPAQK